MTTTQGVQRVPWAEFRQRFVWQQGEHVSLIGPTGSGKTTVAINILDVRNYVVAIGTKPRDKDKTLQRLIKEDGYKLIRKWPPPPITGTVSRSVLWPKYVDRADLALQRYTISEALGEMFRQGNWCVLADELYYLCQRLKLQGVLEDYWTQGRSIGLSLVGGTQRPVGVPLFMYDQATHLFFWKDNDDANLKRIGGLGALNSKVVRELVAGLPKHDTLYVNTRDDELLITRAER